MKLVCCPLKCLLFEKENEVRFGCSSEIWIKRLHSIKSEKTNGEGWMRGGRKEGRRLASWAHISRCFVLHCIFWDSEVVAHLARGFGRFSGVGSGGWGWVGGVGSLRPSSQPSPTTRSTSAASHPSTAAYFSPAWTHPWIWTGGIYNILEV